MRQLDNLRQRCWRELQQGVRSQKESMMKRIGIVDPGGWGHELGAKAHENGYEVVVFSAEVDGRRVKPVLRDKVKIVTVDTNDAAALSATVGQMHQSHEGKLDALISGRDPNIVSVASIARSLGLIAPQPLTALAVRQKHVSRQILEKAHIKTPKWQVVKPSEDLESLTSRVGFPAVVKPTDGVNSQCVRKVTTVDELREAVRAVRAHAIDELGVATLRSALIEEYIAGEEFSVEGLTYRGVPNFLSVTRKQLGQEPHFVEVGHITPSGLPPPAESRVRAYVGDILKAIGLTDGAFHAELRVRHEEPILMEIAGRPPGDKICELILLSTGADMLLGMIQLMCGDEPLAANPSRLSVFTGVRYFERPGLRTYAAAENFDAMTKRPCVVRAELLVNAGDEIPPPPATNAAGRLGFVIGQAETLSLLQAELDACDKTVQFAPASMH